MMPFSAILFDLDGTLLNTIPDLCDATNAMRADLGRSSLNQDTVATYVGKGVEQLVIRALEHDGPAVTPDALTHAMDSFAKHYRACNGRRSEPYPGVFEGLDLFRRQGARLAVVTNKSTAFTLPLLESAGLAKYFDPVVCGDTCARKKPDPMPLRFACEQLGISAAEALFVGDSINDALAARAAGMRVLALPYGYNEGRPVQGLPVDAIVQTLVEAAHWAADATPQTESLC